MDHARLAGARAERLDRLVLGLRERQVRVAFDHLFEELVHPVHDLGHGAEVLRYRLRPRRQARFLVPLEHRARLSEGRDVRPPEAVYRLLGVADQEELPGLERDVRPGRGGAGGVFSGGEQEDHLGLDRVRVLELVHQQELVAPPQVAAHLGVLGDHSPCLDEQVLEIELALGDAAPRRLFHEPGEGVEEACQRVGPGGGLEVGEDGRHLVKGVLDEVADVAIRPVPEVPPVDPEVEAVELRLQRRRSALGKLLQLVDCFAVATVAPVVRRVQALLGVPVYGVADREQPLQSGCRVGRRRHSGRGVHVAIPHQPAGNLLDLLQ